MAMRLFRHSEGAAGDGVLHLPRGWRLERGGDAADAGSAGCAESTRTVGIGCALDACAVDAGCVLDACEPRAGAAQDVRELRARAALEACEPRTGIAPDARESDAGSAPDAPAANTPTASSAAGGLLFRAMGRGNRMTVAVLSICAAVLLVAVVVTGIACAPQATATDLAARSLAPSLVHPFGTDRLGHDMLLRTLSGLSTSMLIGLVAVAVSSLIALVLGCASALGGRKVDAAITWLIDLMLGIPHIVLLILISYALGKGFWGVVAGIALTHWPSLARVVRAEVLQVKQAPYMAAARKLGAGRIEATVRHVIPHVLPQFLVGLVLMFPHAILHEASVTFLGFGLSPESAAIGIILSESMSYLSAGMWWLAFFPGLALVLVVMLFDACGSGLRRLLDPASAQE